MKKAIILSECIGVKNSEIYVYKFHFTGVYLGEKIKSVHVYSSYSCDISPHIDYIISIQNISIEKGIIKSDLVNFKALDNLNLF